MINIPFLEQVYAGQRILIAGAGGGFDVVSGIPLALALHRASKEVVLANLAFTKLENTASEAICVGTWRVTAQSRSINYFPEKLVVQWLAEQGSNLPLYGFSHDSGVQPLRAGYAEIIKRHQIDTVVLVDGGTDSLIFGDEPGTGTVEEDACSMVAVAGLTGIRSYLLALGFGIDHFHHVNHHACLENIATLTRDGAYLGAFSITREMPEGAAFLDLVDYLNRQQPLHKSIVSNSVASAIRGDFGDVQTTGRTGSSELFINPLMGLYWGFALAPIVKRMAFAPHLETSQTLEEVCLAIENFRTHVTLRAEQRIPL